MINSSQIIAFLIVSGIIETGNRENSLPVEGGNIKNDLPQGDTASEDCIPEFGEPYKFTAKEQDPETGLYYYGARYYDPKLSRWSSADPPLARGDYLPTGNKQRDANLPGVGGIFNSINQDGYHYAGDNPVKLVDPDGNTPREALFIIADNRDIIKEVAKKYQVSEQAIASIIFQEKLMGAFAVLKDIPAEIDAIFELTDFSDTRTIGIAEMQIKLAGKLLNKDIHNKEQRKEVIKALLIEKTSIELIAMNIAEMEKTGLTP